MSSRTVKRRDPSLQRNSNRCSWMLFHTWPGRQTRGARSPWNGC
ncbi:hypothetical protein E2320_009429 [Naja naja]|nr:hypothetical protein E2320_009429 [Naja naja]